MGCPIRRSRDQRLLASHPGLTQRATSFIASQCQGIHQMPLNCSIPTCPDCSEHIGRKTRHSQGQDPQPLDNRGSTHERRFTLKTLLPHETGEHSRGCKQLALNTPRRTRRPSRSHFSLHMSKNEPTAVADGMAVLHTIVLEEPSGSPATISRSRSNKSCSCRDTISRRLMVPRQAQRSCAERGVVAARSRWSLRIRSWKHSLPRRLVVSVACSLTCEEREV